jgi:hypothetical protein
VVSGKKETLGKKGNNGFLACFFPVTRELSGGRRAVAEGVGLCPAKRASVGFSLKEDYLRAFDWLESKLVLAATPWQAPVVIRQLNI